jgi:hypothetical protein
MDILNGAGNVPLSWPLRALLAIAPNYIKRLVAKIIHGYNLRGQEVNCQLRTMSDVIDEYHIDRIDLLKIDTESAEFDIVAGVRKEHWPLVRQVVMEIHNGEMYARKMGDFLESVGFKLHYQQEAATSANNWSLYAKR